MTANAPPTISFYGGADTLVPSSQLTLLHDQLDDFGVYNESTLYSTKTHKSWTQAELNDFTTKLGQILETYFLTCIIHQNTQYFNKPLNFRVFVLRF